MLLEKIKPLLDIYAQILLVSDKLFLKVHEEFPEQVLCKRGCSDCCNALFDLALIEALYINYCFNKNFDSQAQASILERANKADRAVYRLKKNSYKDIQKGRSEKEILQQMAKERVRCPLLDEQNECVMYESRPLTCRLYGVPTAIGGSSHICGLSGFEEGKSYPTIKMDQLQNEIQRLSLEATLSLNSKYPKLADMLVPLSMALLTSYDDEYLGIVKTTNAENNEDQKK